MVRRWLEVDKVTTKNECNAILQYFIRLFGEKDFSLLFHRLDHRLDENIQPDTLK
jgi:RNA binding exosome subunit